MILKIKNDIFNASLDTCGTKQDGESIINKTGKR